jgi:hypothetical protein
MLAEVVVKFDWGKFALDSNRVLDRVSRRFGDVTKCLVSKTI